MPFSAGADLCCASEACVLLDVTSTSAESWDLIPHVTGISSSESASDNGLVTSSSGGLEIASCGTVTTTGTLSLACHSGVGPGLLCINTNYRLRWSDDCDNIWTAGAVVAAPNIEKHFEAIVKINSVPVNFDIKGNSPVETVYGWKLVQWINRPTCQVTSGPA